MHRFCLFLVLTQLSAVICAAAHIEPDSLGVECVRKAVNAEGTGEYALAREEYLRGADYFRSSGNRYGIAKCMAYAGFIDYDFSGYHEQGLKRCEEAYALLDGIADQKSDILRSDIIDTALKINSAMHRADAVTKWSLRRDSLIATGNVPGMEIRYAIGQGDAAYGNGDYSTAETFYISAAQKAEEEKDYSNSYLADARLRQLYIQWDKPDKILEYSDKCCRAWLRNNRNEIPSVRYRVLITHAALQWDAGDCEGTMRTLECWEDSVGPGAVGQDLCYVNFLRGSASLGQKKYADAVKYFGRSDSILAADPSSAPSHLQKSVTAYYAGALTWTGDYQRAINSYRKYAALMEDEYGRKSMDYARALRILANAEGLAGNLVDGCEHYSQAWNIMRDVTVQDLQMLPVGARKEYWEDCNKLMFDMIPYAFGADETSSAFTADTYEAMMFSKGMMLAVERNTSAALRASGDSALIARNKEIAALRNRVEELRRQGLGKEIMTVYARMDSLDRELSLCMLEAGIKPTIPYTRTSDLVAALHKNDAIVDFYDYDTETHGHVYVAFVLKHGRPYPRLIKVFTQEQADSLVAAAGGDYSRLGTRSSELFSTLFVNLKRELADVRRIFFVPSGILNQIAVESIVLPSGKVLGDERDIYRLTSAREVIGFHERSRMDGLRTAALFGGLAYDTHDETAGSGEGVRGEPLFNSLPYSEGEVNAVAEILAGKDINVDKYIGTEGTGEAFMALGGRSPELLLISTHSFYYSPDNVPVWSTLNGFDNAMYLTGLVMAGGNAGMTCGSAPESDSRGLLKSADIAALDLSGSRLVVLSACGTALGHTTANEGVYGLQRAFKKAGAGTLVMSLWNVSDVAAGDFMIAFHRELMKNGMNRRKAFAYARRELRKKYPDPYYWASFVMVD